MIYVDVEAGLCRRPCCVYKGSPTTREAPSGIHRKNKTWTPLQSGRPKCIQLGRRTMREAHSKALQTRGSRSMQEALLSKSIVDLSRFVNHPKLE